MPSYSDEVWSQVCNGVGEALLDVERTFLYVVESFPTEGPTSRSPPGSSSIQAYMAAWAALDRAHLQLAQLLGYNADARSAWRLKVLSGGTSVRDQTSAEGDPGA